MSFTSDVARWRSNTQRMLDQAPRKVVADLSRDLVLGTPVATGRAKGNWHFSQGATPADAQLDRLDPAGNATLAEIISQVMAARLGVWWISNNLPYIVPLELGHSQQAPIGWVRAALMRSVANLQAAARGV